MGLFKSAWQSENTEEALIAVGKITNENDLCKVVKSAVNDNVKIAAVKKINNQKILMNLYLKPNVMLGASLSLAVVIELLKRLDIHNRKSLDPLYEMYNRSRYELNNKDAERKKGILMYLVLEKYSNSDAPFRADRIKSETDQGLLAELYLGATDSKMKQLYFDSLVSKYSLGVEFANLWNREPRLLDSEAYIIALVTKTSPIPAVVKIVEQIKNRNMLGYIAKNADDETICRAVIDRIDNVNDLLQLAETDVRGTTCWIVAQKLNNQDLYIRAIKITDKADICMAAVNKINDSDVLLKLANDDKHGLACWIIAKKLNDNNLEIKVEQFKSICGKDNHVWRFSHEELVHDDSTYEQPGKGPTICGVFVCNRCGAEERR